MFRIVISILLLFSAHPVWSGGAAWEFKIAELKVDDNKFEMALKPVDEANRLAGNCDVVTVKGDYHRLRWWIFNRDLLSSENHSEALNYLSTAYSGDRLIRFGEMGAGLQAVSGDNPCAFDSRGLLLIEENSTGTVYSVYETL